MLSDKIMNHPDFMFVGDMANLSVKDFASRCGIDVLDMPTATLDHIIDRLTQAAINARDRQS